MSFQYLQKGMGDEVHFWPEDKPNSFLQGDSVVCKTRYAQGDTVKTVILSY